MTTLSRRALAALVLSAATVESFYDGSRSGTAEQCLKALCESHERLRAETQGAEVLLDEDKKQLDAYKHACLAALGFLGGVSILSKEQLQTLLADTLKKAGVNQKWSSG